MKMLAQAVFLLLIGGAAAQVTECKGGWLSFGNFCYLFNNDTSSKVTWTQAKEECNSRSAQRLRIETLDEYNFVKKSLLLYASDGYWTDLNDLPFNEPVYTLKGSGIFMWGNDEVTDDTVVKAHWDREPSNTDFKDCVFINTQGALAVADCSNKHAYICQINIGTDSECPPGNWISGSSNICYYFSNATAWTQLLTWDQARKTCESWAPYTTNAALKARMLAIGTKDTQTFLASNLAYYSYGALRQSYWTGLNDKNQEGTWQWIGNLDTQYNAANVQWKVEPNNLGGKENCGSILSNGAFNDANCEDKNNFACRMPLASNPGISNQGCGNWMRAGQKCVYVYNHPRTDWNGARYICQQQGGDLLQYDNEDDVMWIRTIARTLLTDVSAYYIGLNDQKTENLFRWPDGSEAPGYLLDWDHEPNNFRVVPGQTLGSVEQCGMMGRDGTFSDRSCKLEHAGSVCEEVTAGCGAGWTASNGHCYLVDTNWRNRPEAAANCKAKSVTGNGRLFALSTQAEKDFILAQIKAAGGDPFFYWSNLADWDMDGQWTWANADEDDPSVYKTLVVWLQEPNDWGPGEDCVSVGVNALLNDVQCNTKTGFICQRRLSGTASALRPGFLTALLCMLCAALFR